MIVICPNCGVRYQLAVTQLPAGKRMRCAECDHRWVPEPPPAPARPEPVDDEEALATLQAVLLGEREERPQPAPPPEPIVPEPEPEPEPVPEDDDAPQRTNWLAVLVVLVAAAALSVMAAGIWLGGVDFARVPVIGQVLGEAQARLAPPPSPLRITVSARVTMLPSGVRLLELEGIIANPSARSEPVPPLRATLAVGDEVVRRWTVAPPVPQLSPRSEVSFTSTVTDFPAEARTVRLATGD